jgi:hypothetical protein
MRIAGYGAAFAVAVLAATFPGGIGNGRAAEREFPSCRAIHIESPNRRWTLASECTLNCPARKTPDKAAVPVCSNNPDDRLFQEETDTRRKQPIAFYGYSGNAM